MRSEESILAGTLEFTIGGRETALRELRIKELREWKKGIVDVVGTLGDLDYQPTGTGVTEILTKISDMAGDKITDLVLAYDVEKVLGSREDLEDTATASELYRAFRLMLEAAFPFVTDIQTAITQVRALVAQSAQVSSTSSPSPSGVSTPRRSKAA